MTTKTEVLNPNNLAAQMIEASEAYREAVSDMNDVIVQLGIAELTKEKAIAITLLSNLDDPKRLGSNEAAREASIRNLNLSVFEKVDELKQELARLKGLCAENEIGYSTIKMLIRLSAINAGVSIE